MSVETDNKNFVTSVLSWASAGAPDFSNYTYGLWASVFENVNNGIGGYSMPTPLLEDIAASNFLITGKKYSILDFDGKNPEAKFFLTRGVKGIDGYEFLEALADITDSFVSGAKPEVIMPDMDYAGKIYRRTEVSGNQISFISKNKILAVSGEDWEQTSISVNSNNTDLEYSYADSTYTGYSNEVVTRYKFLYDDSSNSVPKNISYFEIPFQVENGSALKFRIARKSDPLGFAEYPDYDADGKAGIDYSKYKDEVSGIVDGTLNYNLDSTFSATLTQDNIKDIFDDKPVNIEIKGSQEITNLLASKVTNDIGDDYLQLSLVATGDLENVYRLNASVERYKLNAKTDVAGYVMSEYKMSESASVVTISLAAGDQVYPRIQQNGSSYGLNDVKDLVDVQQVIESEEYAQDLQAQEAVSDEEDEETFKVLADAMKSYTDQLAAALKDDDGSYGGDSAEDVTKIRNTRIEQDQQDTLNLINQNNSVMTYKVALPNFPLPKKTYTRDYFSNYLNTGERYVLCPLSNYTNIPIFASYGNEYGVLAYYINEDQEKGKITNQPYYRTVVNSTCKGIYIDEVSFCKGDTAIYDNTRYSVDDLNIQNGLVTQIPSNGIIKKDNYFNPENWKTAINYYYTKNYLASFNVQPSFSESDYSTLFTSAFQKVNDLIGGPSASSTDSNSFYKKGGVTPRIFIEREIYTEKYNENQIEEFNRSFTTGVYVAPDADLGNEEIDKLYCVQSYDVGNFTKVNQQFFYPIQNYDETLEFLEFFPESTTKAATYDGTTVSSYTIDTDSTFGNILFEDKKPNYKRIFRAEYVVGTATLFSYNNFSSSVVAGAISAGQVSISNRDPKQYAYHLYSYVTAGGQLTLEKSNVANGYIVSGITNPVVIKFTRLEYTDNTYTYTVEDSAAGNYKDYTALAASITDNSSVLISSNLVKINVQCYEYNITSPNEVSCWWIFNENPVNNNIYGERDSLGSPQPRFLQDDAEETKAALGDLLLFPNGPYTSKNYEGTPININNANAFADGLFENNIYVLEEDKTKSFYEANCSIDFEDNGSFTKQRTPQIVNNGKNTVSFSKTRRLKITKIKYNFYVKDLVLIGDAGFPYSINYNGGWDYKLQYRLKNTSDSWVTLDEDTGFTKDKISVQSAQISPYYYSTSDLVFPNFLSMMAFKTNLPLFLDDNSYEFRIAKYEKLELSTQNVDVLKKTNFLPTKVDWTIDPDCDYYNIYQKDRGGNLTLIKTQNESSGTSYAIPDVKQGYVDDGVFNFGGSNGTGYYDIIVSGIVPAALNNQSSLSDQYNGLSIGDTNKPISVKTKVDSNFKYTTKAIANPVYSSIIDFNNPETKTSNFTISPNYNGYYFVASGATSVDFNNVVTPFEAYVANVNTASCSVNETSVASNNVAIIQGPSAPSTTAVILGSSLTSTFDLSDAVEGSVIYLKNSITITDSSVPPKTASGNLKFKVINDSASTITVTYITSVSVLANKTAFLEFSSTAVTEYSTAISNLNVQDDSIYYPNAGLVNIDHTNLVLDGYSSYGELPIYNASKESLSVDTQFYGSLTLDPESFNYFTQTATVCYNDKKSYFDDIKIYLVGGDNSDNNGLFYLKDDTEIILDNYAAAAEKSKDEYYFIKDESINRNLNIKITNGSSSFIVPRANQDFKLSVEKKRSGNIVYKILYPSDNPFFEIDDTLEQMVLLNSSSVQSIDLVYLEASIPKNAFVYFVNKTASPVYFYRGKISNIQNTLAENQIARASIVTSGSSKGIKIDILNNAYSHFEFKIDPSVHLANTTNILNLDFCSTQIEIPNVSGFVGKDLFLICKNRTVPNRIDPQRVISNAGLIQDTDNPDTKDVNEIGNISERSISLRLYKNGPSDTNPTLERTNFLDFSADNSNPLIVQDDATIKEDKTEYFYVNDSGNLLNTFSLRDYYSRNSSYKGKIFTQKKANFTVLSFDGNNKFEPKEANSLSFDYNPDNFVNGRLLVENKSDASIYNNKSEKDSTGLSFANVISSDQIVVNFAYDFITVINVSNKRLNKNRLVKKTGSNYTYPIYNKKEFFLAAVIDGGDHVSGLQSYYRITANDTDIDTIIIPDSSSRSFIIKNTSARTYNIQTLSYDGATYSATISPSEQAKLSYSSGWSKVSNSEDLIDGTLIIKSSNQEFELDPNHPLKSLWGADFNFDSINNAFIGQSGEETEITLGEYEYTYVDYVNAGVSALAGFTIYCFGRKKQITGVGQGVNYLVNAFYLFIYYDKTIVKYMQVYSNGKEFFGEVTGLKIIEEKHIDLSKYLINYRSVSSLPSTALIPIVDQLTTYYLPNLDKLITDFDSGLAKTIGEWISGKKIIFVNLCESNSSAPNKIINYSTSVSHSIYNNLSTLSFTAGVSAWSVSAGTKPEVMTVIPTVKNIKNITSTGSSEIYDGSEFVYLHNFSKFNIDLNSFKNNQLGNFYLFNSAINDVYAKRSSKISRLGAHRFSKIIANQTTDSISSQDLGINGSAPFISVELTLTKDPSVDTVNDLYPNLKFGSLIKIIALINGTRKTYLFKYGETQKAKAISIKDENFASLDLERITTSLPNHRLFIYGSSQINEAGNFFDSYDLKLLNTDSLGSEKFYVQNNTPYYLNICFKSTDTVSNSLQLPPKRMVEISSNTAAFMEYHKKGSFYINKNRLNTNFIQKIETSLFLDSLLNYKNLNSIVEKVNDSVSNNAVSFLSNNFSYGYYSYYDKDGFYFPSYVENRKMFLLDNSKSMDLAAVPLQIQKPNLSISSSGHYIFNNNDNDLKISPAVSDMFLVNNCAKDISLRTTDGTNTTLFRNTVLVLKAGPSSGIEFRYLKKAKSRDEFYCIFNPKTTISSQREITLNTGIPRNNDVFPILDLNNDTQQSYVKLLAKLGSSSIIYLNLIDYYNGKDVPTDSPQNVVAYELGIGHETFYKFLFFNPSNSTYTMPGIKSGETYQVSIDYGLFRDLKTLPNSDGDRDLTNLLDPCVIYKGKVYSDEQTFKGEEVSNYEVRYPNYVKLNKVISNIEKTFEQETKADEETEEGLPVVEEVLDLSALFNQAVVDQVQYKSNSVISWIPQSQNAFWLESQFNKDLWAVSSVDPSTTFTISYPEGSANRYVKFTKCLLKKEDLKTVVFNYSFNLASALQDRKEIANQRDLTIGLDADLESKQLAKVKGWLNQDQNKQDFLLNIPKMPIGYIYEASLIPPKGSSQDVVKNSSCQIKFQLEKLNKFPKLNFEDMSQDQTVKLLNGK